MASSDKNKRKKGDEGEEIAAALLASKGCVVIARNKWVSIPGVGRREIDIIALDGDALVLAEVRTREAGERSVDAADSLDARKLRHMFEAANYLLSSRAPGIPAQVKRARIDLIAINKNGAAAELRHIKDLREEKAD